jgi:hypothetical protein
MPEATIDHMVALTVFLAALLLFITLFNQTLQTAILYQQHSYIASKCTDMLDSILLNPGYPTYWGAGNITPSSFGLQDPEFTQYRLSPFSLMRLAALENKNTSVYYSGTNMWNSTPVYYSETNMWYSNVTIGFGNYLLVPYNEAMNYTTVAQLLGTNNSFGFQLTIQPIVTVSVSEYKPSNPLIMTVNVSGNGFPLSRANLSYCLFTADLQGSSPSYAISSPPSPVITDDQGFALLRFPQIQDPDAVYALIVYAHLSGLTGVGYYQRVSSDKQYIVPFVNDFASGSIILAHSYDIHDFGPPNAELTYNATYVILTQDFTLREMPMDNATGKVNYGSTMFPYGNLTIPTSNPGILVVTYRKSATEGGIILMPWGISSMAFPIVFGDTTTGREWIATDTRQVIVNGIAYQAKLALWSLQGQQVIG